MRAETYVLESRDAMMTFEFISEGPKGSIKKRVQFTQTKQKDIYNLALGDVNIETNDFDDKVVTDNKDSEKVLATVAATVEAFMKKYPNARVYAEGNTDARTRLYRIGISNNLEAINEKFIIFGLLEGVNWQLYEKNKNYLAFLIRRKKR